jgi:hypothetical protein
MATKKALVLNTDGQIEQLQAGDTLAGAGSPSVITATDTFDFGQEDNSVIKTIANASLTSANFNSFSFLAQETTDTTLDEFNINGVHFTIENIVDSTSFDIRATAVNNASGIYTIKYFITHQ